jgi:FlaA1/EpsC-like NDP-sugar epimerase
MFSRRSRFISFSCVLNDLLATIVAFLFAYGLRVWVTERIWHLHPIYRFEKYLPVLITALLLFPFFGYVLGAYRQIEFRRPRDIATDVVKMVALGMLSLFACLFVTRGEFVSRAFLIAFGTFEFFLVAVGRWVFLASTLWLRAQPERIRNFVIVGTTQGAVQVASLLEEGQRFGLRLLAFIYTGDKPTSLPSLRNSYSVLPKETLTELLHNHIVSPRSNPSCCSARKRAYTCVSISISCREGFRMFSWSTSRMFPC